MIDLQAIQEFTEAEIVLLADEKGNVKDSLNTKYDTNIALMIETAFSMCKDLSTDLTNGNLTQLLAKASEGYFVVNKLEDNSLIMVVSKNPSNLGLLLKYLSSEKNFKQKETN